MKKAVILFSSPHENGCTRKLLDVFLSQCRFETHIYNMYKENPAPCIGCRRCETDGLCFCPDMTDLLRDVFSADYVIFASPVYNYSFPAPMKAFLDRLQPYYTEEKTAPVRKGFLLATCGKSGKFSIELMEKQSRIAFSELSAEYCGCYFQIGTDKNITLQEDEICKVKELATSFFSD